MTPCSDALPVVPDDPSDPSVERRPGPAPCVFVVGMHRSGTSATTAVLGRLGLQSPSVDELIPATRTNSRGHHESKALVRFNERLLAALGGSWTAPPTLAPGWERDAALAAVRAEATDTFATVFPRRTPDQGAAQGTGARATAAQGTAARATAAWKDPRNCIVLPFWRAVLGPGTAAVLVYRDPLEVARSLQARDGLTITHGLALWERYVRSACANLDGIPTFCTDYRHLLDDPRGWCTDAVAFLTRAGVVIDAGRVDGASAPVDTELRHQAAAVVDDGPGPGDSGRRIVEILRSLDGPHHPWRAPDLGPEPPWVDDVLTIRRELDLLERAHRALTASRALRFATAVGRLRRRRQPATGR